MRHQMVSVSRAAGMEPPLDTVFVHLQEAAAFAASCAAANAAFTPTAEQVAWAEKITAAFDEAEATGSASIQVDGYFVDYPIVEKARRTLALTAAIRAAG